MSRQSPRMVLTAYKVFSIQGISFSRYVRTRVTFWSLLEQAELPFPLFLVTIAVAIKLHPSDGKVQHYRSLI